MGWQDRDWAKWTDEERSRFLGGSSPSASASSQRGREIALAAMVVSVLASAGFVRYHGLRIGGAAPRPAVVYGTVMSHFRGEAGPVVCTAITNGFCTTWVPLSPGLRPVEAVPLPPGPLCSALQADQHSGHWICAAATSANT